MRQIVLFAAAILVAAGLVSGKMSDKFFNPNAAVAKSSGAPQPAPATRGELTLARGADGHFHTDGRVDGRGGISFVVDTGASTIALRESDAARAGYRPFKSDYTQQVSTANGVIKGARVTLDKVELGDVTVRDVVAIILPDEALSVNLLGMTYLSRLKKFEVASGRLTLVQ
jgi:aspartyl protease family protein